MREGEDVAPQTPLYLAVADDLRESIATGTYSAGDQLPSESKLMQAHNVSRNTVRQALALLVNDGVITSARGRGYYVRHTEPLVWVASDPEANTRTDISPADSWSAGIRAQGREPHETIAVAIEQPSPRIRDALQLTDEAVVVRRRLRYVDGEAFNIADTYYPEPMVRGTAIAQPADVLPGTYVILRGLGLGWASHRNRIRSRMPTREEEGRLGLERGTPVIDHLRISYTADGRPVRAMLTIAPGDRNEIEYVTREDE